MLEIELKFQVADFAPILQKLRDLNALPDVPREQADHYYNAPDRDFAQTDEALRIRACGAANVVTYKGPKQQGPAKTRTEIEVALEGGPPALEQFASILAHLGYRAVAVVRKKRLAYHLHRAGFGLEVCLDYVDDLGHFVEVEIVAPEERKALAEKVLVEVADNLGLIKMERRSYLELFLQKRGPEPVARVEKLRSPG